VTRRLAGRRPLFAMATASFALKLALAMWIAADDPARFMTPDSHTYLQPAEALVTAGVYAASPQQLDVPETLRTPGYPVFIAAVYALAGHHLTAVVMAQILVSLGALVLAYLLATELWDHQIGVVAGLLLGLDLASFVSTLRVLTETLFTFVLTAALYCAVRFRRSALRLRWCGLFGAFFAASVLVRPIAYYLAGPLAFWVLLVCLKQRAGWRRSAVAVLVFTAPFVLAVGGWQLRNGLRTGTALLSRIAGVDLLYYRGAAVLAQRDGISLHEARERLGYESRSGAAHLTPEELSERWRREGQALILGHPVVYARTMVRPIVVTLIGTPEHSLMNLLGLPLPSTGPLGDLLRLDPRAYVERWVVGRTLSWLAFVVLIVYLLLLHFGLASAWWRLARAGRLDPEHGCLALVFLYLLLVSAGPEAYWRFRVPLTPILCVYAAAGLSTWRRGDSSPSAER